MSFDWKKAKEGCHVNHYASSIPQRHIDNEMMTSLMMHIENQVKHVTDIDAYHRCGNNPYAYVCTTFVDRILMPYLAQHRIDADVIMTLATRLRNDPDNAKFGMNEGLGTQAIEQDGCISISPLIIMKAIVDRCM